MSKARMPHGRAEWNRNARSLMEIGAPVLHGPDQRFEKVGISASGRPKYKGTFQAGISYRPDPINKPQHFLPSNPKLDPQPGGGLRSEEGDADIRLPPRANGAFVFRLRHLEPGQDDAFTMRFEGANNSQIEKLSDTEAIYRDVFTNLDLKLRIGPRGWKTDWIYKGPGHPTEVTVLYTSPYDRDAIFVSNERVQINVHDPAAHADYSFIKLGTPFYADPDGPVRSMTASEGIGPRIVYTLPDMSDVAYPFTFDPITIFKPDANIETDTVDGWTGRQGVNETFGTIRAGAGTFSNDSGTIGVALEASTTTDQFDYLRRGIVSFDLRVFNGAWIEPTIAAADISLFLQGNAIAEGLGTFDIDIVRRSDPLGAYTAIGTGDHPIGDYDTATVYGSFALGSVSTVAYNEFTFTSVPAELLSGEQWDVGLLSSWDTDNSFGGTWSSGTVARVYFESADSTPAPKLEVTFEVGDDGAQIIQGSGDDTAASSMSTVSWTPNANQKCYFFLYAAYTDAAEATAPVISGNGMTWSLREGPGAASVHPHWIWEGSAEASPTTGAITVTYESPDTSQDHQYLIFQSSRYQGYVQSGASSVSNSTTSGASPALPAARNERNLVVHHEVWRHSGESAGPFNLSAASGPYPILPDDQEDETNTSTGVVIVYVPDPEGTDDWQTAGTTWTTPGAVLRKTGIVLELAPTDADLLWLDNGQWEGTATASKTTNSFTPTASYDTYLWVYVRTTNASDGDPTVSGNGHTWTKQYGVAIGSTTNHHFYLYKGTGGTTAGVATVTCAGSDLMNQFRWCASEVPESWTQTQTASSSGVDTTTGDWTLSATFSASTSPTNRMVLAFGGVALVDQEIVPTDPLDFWDLVHDAGAGTQFVLMDTDGGAYTANTVYSDNTGGNLKYAFHVIEFGQGTLITPALVAGNTPGVFTPLLIPDLLITPALFGKSPVTLIHELFLGPSTVFPTLVNGQDSGVLTPALYSLPRISRNLSLVTLRASLDSTVANDVLIRLRVAGDNALDLTNATAVTADIYTPGRTSVVADRACTITTAARGLVTLSLTDTDLTAGQVYFLSLKVSWGGTTVRFPSAGYARLFTS